MGCTVYGACRRRHGEWCLQSEARGTVPADMVGLLADGVRCLLSQARCLAGTASRRAGVMAAGPIGPAVCGAGQWPGTRNGAAYGLHAAAASFRPCDCRAGRGAAGCDRSRRGVVPAGMVPAIAGTVSAGTAVPPIGGTAYGAAGYGGTVRGGGCGSIPAGMLQGTPKGVLFLDAKASCFRPGFCPAGRHPALLWQGRSAFGKGKRAGWGNWDLGEWRRGTAGVGGLAQGKAGKDGWCGGLAQGKAGKDGWCGGLAQGNDWCGGMVGAGESLV